MIRKRCGDTPPKRLDRDGIGLLEDQRSVSLVRELVWEQHTERLDSLTRYRPDDMTPYALASFGIQARMWHHVRYR